MEAVIIPVVLVLFSLLAIRHGHDSRPRAWSQEESLANSGFRLDHETTSVFPDAVASASAGASKSAIRVFRLRTG